MKTKKISVIVSSAVLLLALLFPPTAKGQWDSGYGDPWGDGKGTESETRGDDETSGPSATWSDFDNGNPLPTGSGLLVLALSGVCYAGAKRLKKQKVEKVETHRSASEKCKDLKIKKMKNVLFIMAAALLTMTQCRKSSDELTPSEAVTVRMTVTTGPGGRTEITTAGGIRWSEADKLYVGDGEKCVGVLTLLSGGGSATATFSGDVTVTEGGHTFHFYYLGSATNVDVNATEATVDFSSQDIYADDGKLNDAGKYHVGYGKVDNVDVKADTPITGIQVGMKSKVAIAYFRFESGTETPYIGALTLSGDRIYNKMTVNFEADDFNFTGTKGCIRLAGGCCERYAMLVPAGTSAATLYFGDGDVTGATALANGIEANKFYRIDGNMPIEVEMKPVEFTVDADGTKVTFSPGNLQYLGLAEEGHKWRFAEHQWDYMGAGPTGANSGNVDLRSLGYSTGMYNTSSGSEAARDLFGWGCTGIQDTRDDAHTYQRNYMPYSTSNTAVGSGDPAYNINRFGYGPDYYSGSKYNLTVANKSDWGCVTGLPSAGEGKSWRTLSKAEWAYLLNTSGASSGARTDVNRFAKAMVNGVKGLLIFPDGYNGTAISGITGIATVNNTGEYYPSESIPTETWESMESAGVVFLPAAGSRNGKTLTIGGVLTPGYYWSSSCHDNPYEGIESTGAYYLGFSRSIVMPLQYINRFNGHSVRLVR